ncbi:MAG: hypothetical protein JWQ35_785 [Bacteriovoracaceae bacterium]|nr:hypothetical protein [Bacteriovoracaceae bacterium]
MSLRVWNSEEYIESTESDVLGGSNFLVSAVLILKKQKKELETELKGLKDRVKLLEYQNASFMNVSAERLLKTLG